MELKLFQIDAFTDRPFGGNPAAVVPLKEWLPDEILLNIAKENNLAETAYFIHETDNIFHLKWFTPEIEMDLCGHATLATAFVIFNCLDFNFESIVFNTLSGVLKVSQKGKMIELVFPSRPPLEAELPEIIKNALSIQPKEVYKSRDYMLVYSSENEILNLKVSASILEQINLDPGGIVVTAKGKTVDFVSRFFTPGAAVFEDPVTGSAHCTLVPFWANRLGKVTLKARQLSDRGGDLLCTLHDEQVYLTGSAIKYLEGEITV